MNGRYDGGLQMFVEEEHVPDPARLAFLRWLGEHGRLEHAVYGPPSGEQARLRGAGDVLGEAAGTALASGPDGSSHWRSAE